MRQACMIPRLSFAAMASQGGSQTLEPCLDAIIANAPEILHRLVVMRRSVIFECVQTLAGKIGACRTTVQPPCGSADLDVAWITEIRPLAAAAGIIG